MPHAAIVANTRWDKIVLWPEQSSRILTRATLEEERFPGVGAGCAVSSVVEHFLDTEGVRGSNPLSRTIWKISQDACKISCFQLSPGTADEGSRGSRVS